MNDSSCLERSFDFDKDRLNTLIHEIFIYSAVSNQILEMIVYFTI